MTVSAIQQPGMTGAREEFLPYGPHRDRETLQRVASSPLSLLISGETGTGKEVLAREIHVLSGRSGGFVAINCGAIAEGLAESELFGHEKGSFTGAVKDRRGYMEEAQGGTLFLDEITEMPLAAQRRLLRVLQERVVVRVGGTRQIPLDVRVLSATNLDPAEAVSDGKLRQDLYYRLNQFCLRLPALREQPQDVVPLAEFFLRQAAREAGVAAGLTEDAKEQLAVPRQWPGNIRQLKSLLQTAFYLHAGPAGDRRITGAELKSLPAPYDEPVLPSSSGPDAAMIAVLAQRSLAEIRAFSTEARRAAILRALAESRGSVSEAAEMLGVDRVNLNKTIHRTFGVSPQELLKSLAYGAPGSRPGKA